MTREDAEKKAKSFLLNVSSDDSWIDASSGWVLNQLTDLLMKMQAAGADSRDDSVKAHAALGVFPGAYDE